MQIEKGNFLAISGCQSKMHQKQNKMHFKKYMLIFLNNLNDRVEMAYMKFPIYKKNNSIYTP